MDILFRCFLALAARVLSQDVFERRLRAFDVGLGFRLAGFNWFPPHWFPAQDDADDVSDAWPESLDSCDCF